MTTIAAISGSLREGSYNTALLRAAADLTPTGCTVDHVSIMEIPLYDADLESEGVPDAVTRAKEAVDAADALLLVTPEYNNSMPGVLKNAIDWLSRPPRGLFRELPVGIIGATPGGWGTKLSQTAWLQVVRALSMRPFFGKSLYVSQAADKFDEGVLVDEDTRDQLAGYLDGFNDFIHAQNDL